MLTMFEAVFTHREVPTVWAVMDEGGAITLPPRSSLKGSLGTPGTEIPGASPKLDLSESGLSAVVPGSSVEEESNCPVTPSAFQDDLYRSSLYLGLTGVV